MTKISEKEKVIGRLKKRPEFLRVREEGRRWVSKGMVIELVETNGNQWRYGVTVTKKVSTKAVVRNRIKRRLRAVADQILPLYQNTPHEIVLIGRLETHDRNFAALKNDLQWCLKKLGVVEDA